MQVTAASSFLTDANFTPGSARTPVRTLDQSDFLKLVLAQLTNQDPMNPQKDTEFIAQMTQFTALEQSKSMQGDIAKLQTDQQFMQANAVLGRVVTLQDDQGALIRGTVNAIQVEEGTPKLVVNGQPYGLSALLSIEPATPST
ncbi:MAG TPA: flagellar hook capping FlgD N-terminal domain-containing protein [Verrucomicrobiae bacterium]|jgi:flagellar basal-body rod modification protein FlgD